MRRSFRQPLLLVAALAMLAPLAVDVHAQASTVEQAKQHYQLGYQALQRGDYAAALEQYQRSFDLAPRPRTLFNIAVAEEHLGKLEDARRDYIKFLAIAEPRDDAFKAQAKQKIAALDEKLPKPVEAVTDRTPPPVPDEGAEPPPEAGPHGTAPCAPQRTGLLRIRSGSGGAMVSVDGIIVGATLPARDGRGASLTHSVVPGDHDVIVERTGASALHQRLHLSPGETVEVNVAFRDPHSTRNRILTWGLAGVGVVSISAGATLGVLALRDVTSANRADHSRGKTRATITDVLLVGGAAALYGAWRLHDRPDTTATIKRSNAPAGGN